MFLKQKLSLSLLSLVVLCSCAQKAEEQKTPETSMSPAIKTVGNEDGSISSGEAGSFSLPDKVKAPKIPAGAQVGDASTLAKPVDGSWLWKIQEVKEAIPASGGAFILKQDKEAITGASLIEVPVTAVPGKGDARAKSAIISSPLLGTRKLNAEGQDEIIFDVQASGPNPGKVRNTVLVLKDGRLVGRSAQIDEKGSIKAEYEWIATKNAESTKK